MKSRSYSAYLRLNRVEYSDLVTDLESLPKSERPARVKMLLRLGLSTLKESDRLAGYGPSFNPADEVVTFPANGQAKQTRGD